MLLNATLPHHILIISPLIKTRLLLKPSLVSSGSVHVFAIFYHSVIITHLTPQTVKISTKCGRHCCAPSQHALLQHYLHLASLFSSYLTESPSQTPFSQLLNFGVSKSPSLVISSSLSALKSNYMLRPFNLVFLAWPSPGIKAHIQLSTCHLQLNKRQLKLNISNSESLLSQSYSSAPQSSPFQFMATPFFSLLSPQTYLKQIQKFPLVSHLKYTQNLITTCTATTRSESPHSPVVQNTKILHYCSSCCHLGFLQSIPSTVAESFQNS